MRTRIGMSLLALCVALPPAASARTVAFAAVAQANSKSASRACPEARNYASWSSRGPILAGKNRRLGRPARTLEARI